MITEFNEKGHPMVFSDEVVNTEQLKEKCIKAIESLSGVHGAAERKAKACFKIALSELENNWKQRAEAAEAKLAELEKQEPIGYVSDNSAERASSGHLGYISNHQVAGLPGRYVYSRPAPAINLAELVPSEWTLGQAMKFVDEYNPPSGEHAVLFAVNSFRAAILRNIEEAK